MAKSSKGGNSLYVDEPNMSDQALLMSVENLINMAMGPPEQNTINYKMLQTVLHILAGQLRILEKEVQVNIFDDGSGKTKRKKTKYLSRATPSTATLLSPANEAARGSANAKKARLMEESAASNESEKAERSELKEKEEKVETKKQSMAGKAEAKGKVEKVAAKEIELTENIPPEDKKKYLKEKEKKERDLEKITLKEQEKYLKDKEQYMDKLSPKEKLDYMKDKEMEKRDIEKFEPTEKEKYLKDKERENKEMEKMMPGEKKQYLEEKELRKITFNEREKQTKAKEVTEIAKITSKEKEKYLKEKEDRELLKNSVDVKENMETEKKSPIEKDQYAKDKEKEERYMEKMTSEEKEQYDKNKEREERQIEKITPKEKDQYAKDKEREERHIEKMTPKEKEQYDNGKEREERQTEKMTLEGKEREEKHMKKITSKEKQQYAKDKEREERKIEKKLPTKKEQYFKDNEKEEILVDKMSPKENELYLQDKEKEQKTLETRTPHEEEQYYVKEKLKVEAPQGQKKERVASGTCIALTGPRRRSSGIDIVTQSEFRLLEDAVEELKEKAGPLPMPTLPDSKKLRSDLATGRASLTDTMDALQVSSRVQAVEQAIGRMTKMLTQLAVAGALPEEFARNFKKVKADIMESQTQTGGVRKSVTIEPSSKQTRDDGAPSQLPTATCSPGRTYIASHASGSSHAPITRDQLEHAVVLAKENLTIKIQSMTQRATTLIETATGTTKVVANNMHEVENLKHRVDSLYSVTFERAEELSGFKADTEEQMLTFKEQLEQMKESIKADLAQLASGNTGRNRALMELTARYESLAMDLDETCTAHQVLANLQLKLRDEQHSLIEAIALVKEQKANHNEMLEGLQDKVDSSRLMNLVTMPKFEDSLLSFDSQLRDCYTKFTDQESVRTSALKSISTAANLKAEIMQLLILKGEAEKELTSIQEKLQQLVEQMGEPKAAILMRLLSKDGRCAACKEAALMVPTEPACCQPRRLPALRPPPEGEPCLPKWRPEPPIDKKAKFCNRWAGGSNTLVCSGALRAAPAPPPPPPPSHRYTACGSDGK